MTCVSRFEHLHLLGEGAPPDATFFAFPQNDSEKTKPAKSTILPVLKKKGPGRMQYAAATLMRGSYDSAGIGSNGSGVTSEQVNNLVSNLNMLEQVGSSEMNRIFTRSQKLNSEAIIDFVKALCKVSMEELRSPSDPRVFSLTKMVEIAYVLLTYYFKQATSFCLPSEFFFFLMVLGVHWLGIITKQTYIIALDKLCCL